MADSLPDPRLPALFGELRWHVRPERFAVVGLAPRERVLALRLLLGVTGTFVQCTVEPEALTLVVTETDWRRLSPAFPHARVERPYRVIAFDLDLPPDLIGFLAAITGALAEAGVPLLAACGYARDYVLVREEYLDAAAKALKVLLRSGTPAV